MTSLHPWAGVSIGAWGLSAALTLLPNRASACSFADTTPSPGILSGTQGNPPGPVPRSVAFLATRSTELSPGTSDRWMVAQLDTGETIVGMEVPGTRVKDFMRVVKPTAPFPENVTFSAYRYAGFEGNYQTSATIDATPPSRPELESGDLSFHDGTGACSSDSCGDYTAVSLRLKAPAADDQTTAEQLVYALYLGSSPQEAQTKGDADDLFTGSSLAGSPTLWTIVDDNWIDRDAFVAVAAIDQSGNVSERSVPFQINSGDSGGCAVRGHFRHTHLSKEVLVLGVALGWLRRARKRKWACSPPSNSRKPPPLTSPTTAKT